MLGRISGRRVTDANQLESAILNLAINARDAMPDGGELTIETRNVALRPGRRRGARDAGAPGDYVALGVSDTGAGMPPDVVDKAFDPFFTTKPIGQGTGLGLSMVYGFAQQSGGAAEIQSRPGEGTTISIYLPRAGTMQEGQASAEAIDVPMGIGERVMVVEDDASVRMLVNEVLRDLGYAPVEATNADDALARLRAMPRLDLLISDVGLPGMNGRQLAEMARGNHAGPENPVHDRLCGDRAEPGRFSRQGHGYDHQALRPRATRPKDQGNAGRQPAVAAVAADPVAAFGGRLTGAPPDSRTGAVAW